MTKLALKLVHQQPPLLYWAMHVSRSVSLRLGAVGRTRETIHASKSACLFPFSPLKVWSCRHNFGFWSPNEFFKQQKTLRAIHLFPLFPIFPRSGRRKPAPRLRSWDHAEERRQAAARNSGSDHRGRAQRCARKRQAQQWLSQSHRCAPRKPPSFKGMKSCSLPVNYTSRMKHPEPRNPSQTDATN